MVSDSPEMVRVRVSPDFAALRATQRRLNDFIWSTELCYGYVLVSDQLKARPNDWTHDVLGHITTEAWYPTAKGKEKYRDKVSTFLKHVSDNTTYAYRAVIALFSSAFEDYLEAKRSLINPRDKKGKAMNNGWGPYLQSLCGPALNWEHELGLGKPVRLATVLGADLCRLLRNRIVHAPHGLPLSLTDPEALSWQHKLQAALPDATWYASTKAKDRLRWNRTVGDILTKAIRTFVGGVAHSLARSKNLHGKVLPPEFFYMLFTFTALDALAFEIEEASIGPQARSDFMIFRDPSSVRRQDMLVC
jgi:hypothetical protein